MYHVLLITKWFFNQEISHQKMAVNCTYRWGKISRILLTSITVGNAGYSAKTTYPLRNWPNQQTHKAQRIIKNRKQERNEFPTVPNCAIVHNQN